MAPGFVGPPAEQGLVGRVFEGKEAAAEMLREAGREIKEGRRREGFAVGYFEQGILIGVGVYGLPLLMCVGAGLLFGVRAGLRRWAVV